MIDIVNKKYNDMLYNTRPTKFSELMSNKYNIVHKKIYEQALNKYIEEWIYIRNLYVKYNILNRNLTSDEKIFLNNHKDDKKYSNPTEKNYFDVTSVSQFKEYSYIFEIPNEEYWQPSKCIIMTKPINNESNYRIFRWEVDLTPYWNFYQKKENKDIEKLKIDINENINDSEIIGFNYITGKAKLYSENLDKTYEVDFDYLDGNKNRISEDFSLSKTFMANL